MTRVVKQPASHSAQPSPASQHARRIGVPLYHTSPQNFQKVFFHKNHDLDIFTNVNNFRESSSHWSSRRYGGRFRQSHRQARASARGFAFLAELRIKRSSALVFLNEDNADIKDIADNSDIVDSADSADTRDNPNDANAAKHAHRIQM